MLGAIESLMSAVVSDRMSNSSNVDRNDRHNPNVELVAQGIANVFSPMFGGLPATGAIARTATNIRSGAKTPVAGMIHALTLLAILLFASKLVSFVPMAVLAGILMVVSYNMGEWREIPSLLKLTKTDISVWLVTFALTVFADLTVAVQAGMNLAALLFDVARRLPQQPAVTDDRHIADGYRMLATTLGVAFDTYLFADPSRPNWVEVNSPFRPDRRWGGDNTDAYYFMCPVDPKRRYRISGNKGDSVYFSVTAYNEPSPGAWSDRIVAIVRDDVGSHDVITSMCDSRRYTLDYGVENHRSCRTNLTEAYAPWGIGEWEIPDPFNLFQISYP